MLYEMLARRPPFQTDYEQAVVSLILNQEPEPISNFREDVPGRLATIACFRQAIEKDPC